MMQVWIAFLVACGSDPSTPAPQTIAPVSEPRDVNHVPRVQGMHLATLEDTPISDVVVGTDADDDPLVFRVVVEPDEGAVTMTPEGAFTYLPRHNFSGSDVFQVAASDSFGWSAPASVRIDVEADNEPPRFADVTITTPEDTPISAQLVADDPDGDDLTFGVVVPPVHGTFDLSPPFGTFTYTPDLNFSGTDLVRVDVTDGRLVVEALVRIVVTSGAGRPVVAPASFTTPEDTLLADLVIAMGGAPVTFEIELPPRMGNLTLNGATGQFVYQPDPDVNGLDDFTVVAKNAAGDSLPGRQTIAITPVNDAPVVQGASVVTQMDVPVQGSLTGTDVEGDPLTFMVTTQPQSGTVALSAVTGAFVYTPAPGFAGLDQFEVAASDGQALSAPATVDATVDP